MGLFSFLSQELAMDLGTANTIIIHDDKIVVDEPSIVALDKHTDRTIAIGMKARQMHGKTHDNTVPAIAYAFHHGSVSVVGSTYASMTPYAQYIPESLPTNM